MATRAIQTRIIADGNLIQQLWITHKVFNDCLPAFASTLFRMMRGEIGDSIVEKQRWAGFINGVLKQPAKNAYDCLIKATVQKTFSDKTAANALAKMQAAAQKELDLLKERGAGSGDPAKVADLKATVDMCERYSEAFADFRKGKRPLAPARNELSDLPNILERKVIEESVAILRSHLELVELWKTERQEWTEEKAKWEADQYNRQYLAVRPIFEKFEELRGRTAFRSFRWKAYFEFFKEHPELAAWRGATAEVHAIPEQGLRLIQRAKLRKKDQVFAEEFFKANPELEALHRRHMEYEKKFVRRRKSKRSNAWITGFKSRPTFTLPDVLRHPRWFVFNAPQTAPAGYRNLRLPNGSGAEGSLDLQLLTGAMEDGEYKSVWLPIRFRGDPRLAQFRPVTVKRKAIKGKIKGQETEKAAYVFDDQHLGKDRPAKISGTKLILRDVRLDDTGNLLSATPYLYFTVDVESPRWSPLAAAIKSVDDGVTAKGKQKRHRTLPDGLVVCTVDLGIRNLGFATIARIEDGKPDLLRSRNLWLGFEERGKHEGRWEAGPELASISGHKRELRLLRRMRGRPVAGEESHVNLQEHIDHMGEDRFKRAARLIVNFALNTDKATSSRTGKAHPPADVLVLERLAGFVPQAERERGINRALVEWNRGQLVERLKLVAEDVGLRLFEIGAAGTSQVCSRCGALGRRYSIVPDPQPVFRPAPNIIRFGEVEKLFACPCGYRANADHNAAVNLQRKFVLGDTAIAAAANLWDRPKPEQRAMREAVESQLRSKLEIEHKLAEPFP